MNLLSESTSVLGMPLALSFVMMGLGLSQMIVYLVIPGCETVLLPWWLGGPFREPEPRLLPWTELSPACTTGFWNSNIVPARLRVSSLLEHSMLDVSLTAPGCPSLRFAVLGEISRCECTLMAKTDWLLPPPTMGGWILFGCGEGA